MKKLFSLFTFIFALLSTGAFAQQGFYRAQVPGWGPQGINSSNTVTYELCTASQTVAQCVASPTAITSDQAGNTSITQPATVPGSGYVQFYAPPGTYQLLLAFGSPSSFGNQLIPINVAADPLGNVALADGIFFVPPQDCSAAVSGTAGAGNNTIIIDGSVPALKASSTNAGASNATFTCNFQPPVSRLTSGKAIVITDITYLYSVQTTTATSMVASTFKSFTAPAAGAGESASSATLVDQCNTCVQTPAVASANLTSVSAGQYYSEKVAPGTAVTVGTDLQSFVFTFQINQSASAAQIITTPGLIVHYKVSTI